MFVIPSVTPDPLLLQGRVVEQLLDEVLEKEAGEQVDEEEVDEEEEDEMDEDESGTDHVAEQHPPAAVALQLEGVQGVPLLVLRLGAR